MRRIGKQSNSQNGGHSQTEPGFVLVARESSPKKWYKAVSTFYLAMDLWRVEAHELYSCKLWGQDKALQQVLSPPNGPIHKSTRKEQTPTLASTFWSRDDTALGA